MLCACCSSIMPTNCFRERVRFLLFFCACSPLPQQAIYFTEMSTCSLWGSTGVGTRVLSQRSSSHEQNQGKSQYPYFQKNCSLGDSVNQTRYLIGTPLTLNRLIDDRLYSAILRSLEQHVSAALNTSYTKSRRPKNRNRAAYVCLMTVQLVYVTLQIVCEMPRICDLCSYLGIH